MLTGATKSTILTLFLLFLFNRVMFSQDLEAGKLIPKVYCLNDSNQHYALYLPSYFYNSEVEEWPVIYAFDAAGRGSVPVELFEEASEKYGYIIAGSNISENGPWEPILRAAENMFKDTEARFQIDSTRRYTAGFSGGARVATSVAVLYGTFEGVIGCGAGFSNNYPPHFGMQFSYIGLIGDRDFNFQEMHNLDVRLDKFEMSHYIIEYEGEHEWPPASVITDAVTWLEFRGNEKGVKWVDYNIRDDYYNANLQTIHDLIDLGREYDAFLLCGKVLSFLHGISNTDEVEALNRSLNNNPVVLTKRKHYAKILEEERNYYIQFADAFVCYRINYEDSMTPIKPNSWWREQVKIANSKILNIEDPMNALMGQRMIDFIWRTAYMQYENVQGTEYQPISRYFLEIWAMAQPEAISPYYFLAKYYTRQGKYDKALKSLEDAINRGLSDIALIEEDTLLINLTTMDEYERVVKKMMVNTQ